MEWSVGDRRSGSPLHRPASEGATHGIRRASRTAMSRN